MHLQTKIYKRILFKNVQEKCFEDIVTTWMDQEKVRTTNKKTQYDWA